MIVINCERLYNNREFGILVVDVRTHILDMAIKNKEDIKFTCDKHPNKEMIITYSDLNSKKIAVSKEHKSKFPPYDKYKLVSYEWKLV